MSRVREPLIGALDEGTSSARFILFKAGTAEVVASHQEILPQIYPQEGWVEQDPLLILAVSIKCIDRAVEKLIEIGRDINDVVAVGVTNQERLQFAVKLRWLVDNVPKVKKAVVEGNCMFGTVDSWLIWNLTGGKNAGVHITDVTNASRTMLMNLDTLKWDPVLLKFFDLPTEILPIIKSSSEVYGHIVGGNLQGVPISGCLGDQQSALVGQQCLSRGEAKSTYGTGCFLLYNTGTKRVNSSHGLLTTIAYQPGPKEMPVYALEGSVAIAGAAISWLKDNLSILSSSSEAEDIALKADSTGADVYFVPAFSGLYAPYWKKNARGVIVGITEDTNSSHLVKATLEAVCFQTRDIIDAMNKDYGTNISKLKVDGGMTSNSFLMQMQSDLTGIAIEKPEMAESTSLGVAMMAGAAVGLWELHSSSIEMSVSTWKPLIKDDERDVKYARWKMAVERAMGWEI
ncbi:hypothetical protein FQR65_LT07925 [Abscondita terminalis]|nr:hypothetical protein FQR65_LT07925 [Abscondita terminalis]